MPVILVNNNKSSFEKMRFDAQPLAKVVHIGQPPTSFSGNGILSDDDIRNLTGAPSGAVITYQMEGPRKAGDDLPPGGLYFTIKHPTLIDGKNEIGLCRIAGARFIYIKDVCFQDTAPRGMGRVMLARIVRFCLQNGINVIQLLAAGGRSWDHRNWRASPPASPLRWWGHYVWARCGFDMPLASSPWAADDAALRQKFKYPALLQACTDVSDVVSKDGGADWWRVCGNGWFMTFDSSSANSTSVKTLEAYLGERSL